VLRNRDKGFFIYRESGGYIKAGYKDGGFGDGRAITPSGCLPAVFTVLFAGLLFLIIMAVWFYGG